jgi:MFS family permease/tetratricopeptide (TPR) repeat protein
LPSSEDRPQDNTSSHLTGSAGDVVQARDIKGGIHFHGSAEYASLVPAQLPGNVFGFVNRMEDIEILDRLLCGSEGAPGQVAVCVLTGAPGIGKTALAIRWAHRVREQFPDGQLYVNLRGYDWETPLDPQRVLAGFLIALGVAPGAVPPDREERSSLYRSLLSARQVLIVLDNASTVAQVRPLLPGAGRCRVLITSRGLLSGLAVHGGAQRVTLNLFSEADSVELLRTTTTPYRTADGDQDIAKLAQLCARLPLALRIAAERAAARPRMTLTALIRDLLDESSLWIALTKDGSEEEADAVRSVFAWSYRALPEPTARLFRLLGVFPGAEFSHRVAAVLTGMSESAANRLLGDLVDAHLVEQTGEDLYQFHDLLRAYAGDLAVQIDPSAELEAALAAVLEWYLRCSAALAALDPFSVGHRQVELGPPAPNAAEPGFANYEQAVAWFHGERANITSVIEAAARGRTNAAVWQIPALLRQVFDRERAFDDWFATSELGLAAARALGSDDGQLLLLGSLGRAHFSLNNLGQADQHYSALLARCHEMGHSHDEAVAENVMGVLEIRRHRSGQALAHIDRCDELCHEHDFRELTVNPATNRAQALLAFGRPAEALAMAEQAVEINRSVGSKQAEMYALLYLSEAQVAFRALAAAERSVALAKSLAEESRSRAEEGLVLLYLGAVQIALGNAAAALDSYQEAAAIARKNGDRQREALAVLGAGRACRELARPDEAIDFHRSVIVIWRSLNDPWQTAVAIGELLRDVGQDRSRPDDAQSLRDEAVASIQSFNDPAARLLREWLQPGELPLQYGGCVEEPPTIACCLAHDDARQGSTRWSGSVKATAWRLCGGPYTGLPPRFWRLWASTFLARVANFVVPFSVLYFTADRHLPESVAGLLVGLYGLGTVVGSLAGGAASDRFGSKQTLVAGYAAAGISTVALGLIAGVVPLATCMLAVGAFGGTARPATNALITELVPAESQIRVFALNYWAMNIGFAIACICAGLITLAGYVVLFSVDGATTLACALIVLFRVSSATPPGSSAQTPRQPRKCSASWGRWLELLQDRTFAAVIAMSIVTVALLQQLTVTLPLAMRASGDSPTTYGAIAALNGVLVCGLQMPISSLVTRQRLIQSLALGSILLGLGLGLTAFAFGVMGYAVTVAVWTVGEVIAAPAAPALASLLAPHGDHGTYQGALGAAWGVGAVTGPAAGTFILARGGSTTLWTACAIAGFAVACGYLCLLRPVTSRLAHARNEEEHRVEASAAMQADWAAPPP